VFIFLFFSKSQSKLAPYILPIFPALAVLIGNWLARAANEYLPAVGRLGAAGPANRLRWGLRVYTFVCGLLAVALLAAVYRIGLIIRDPEQALALRPVAIALAVVLLLGGVMVPWLATVRGPRTALTAMVAATGLFYLGILWARPWIQKPGTKELAEMVNARVHPGDRVLHYFDFFHDFTFYAARTVDLVGGDETARRHEFSELEFVEDAAAVARDQLISETRFREIWTQPTRIFVVAKKRDVHQPRADGKTPLFADPTFHYHLLAETRDHYLFSNQP
jgi:4-amino-4-deoxy-L-arabinose transferase-like glycosyltransferase